MSKDNLPLALYERNQEELTLDKPVFFDGEQALFEKRPKSPANSAVVFLPKSKGLIDMTLALVSGIVKEGGTVVLSGEKKAGIESVRKFYESNIGPIDQKIVGNHSAMYVGKNRRLSADKKLEDFLTYFPLSYSTSETSTGIKSGAKIELEVANLPGVFSIGELDEGTKLLLDHIPYDKSGASASGSSNAAKVLDMACGSGVVGAIYKKLSPKSTVTMCDSSILAVEAAKKTLEKNDISGDVFLSDIFSGLGKVQNLFDFILVNPPFHSGITTDYSFIERFARDAKKYLAPGGEIYLVANSFLSYKETLEKYIGPTDIIVENKKFRVFRTKI